MIASLGMYDPPWLHAANDGLWQVIAKGLRAAGLDDVPDALTRDMDLHAIWRTPDLLLAQTCGYPLISELEGHVSLLATPCYDAQGCEGAHHRAAILVRADDPAASIADLRGRRVGVNDMRSNSGMNLLRGAVAPFAEGASFFGSVRVTGAHARSFTALLSGAIDVAALDCVTLAQLRARHPQQADRLRILAWTDAVPGLPLIISAAHADRIEPVRAALDQAVRDPIAQPALRALGVKGFSALDWDDYAVIGAIERRAVERGYPTLN